MRKSRIILSLLVSSLVLNSCFADLGCLFEFPEHKNELRLMEIKYSESISDVQVLRKNVFIGEGTNIPHEFELNRLYYSYDGMTSYFRHGKKGFMNYGSDEKVFQQPLLINHPTFLEYYSSPDRSDFDYQLSSNTSIYHDYILHRVENPFTGDSISTTTEFLIEFDHNLSSSDTLQRFESVFVDSITYRKDRIVDQRYTPEGEILMVTGNIGYTIKYSEEYDYYFGVKTAQHSYHLLKVNRGLLVDTLFTVHNEEEPASGLLMAVSAEKILLSTRGPNTYQFNGSDGSLKFLYSGGRPRNIAVDDQSLTFDKGRKHYSFLEEKVTDLTNYFDDIIYSMPYKNLVAVQTRADEDKIFVFDLNSKSISYTIRVDDLPEFKQVVGNSSYRLENPIFTEDGELIFMYIRETYLTDVEYEKRCG
ncbi:hypothetical protein ABFW99_010630 [Gracilimonas sp. BCB1]